MAMRRLLASAGTRRSAPVAWMSTVEKLERKVDLSPQVLTASPAGDQPSDLNKFFEISGEKGGLARARALGTTYVLEAHTPRFLPVERLVLSRRLSMF